MNCVNSITNNGCLFTVYAVISPIVGIARVIANIARIIFYDLWIYFCKGRDQSSEQLKKDFIQILLGFVEVIFLIGPCAIFYYAKTQNKLKLEPIFQTLDPISQALAFFNNPSINGQINGIYITTNETNLSATQQLLKKYPKHSDEKQTIHIGCATWHNFDVMCERRSTYGLIVDFNSNNAKFIAKTIDVISVSETRDLFKQNMIAYLDSLKGKSRKVFFHGDQVGLPTDRIERELSREGSWLQTEETYDFIKSRVSKGFLVAITEDITNCETSTNIRQFLDKNNIRIDTLYLSNICNFMNTDNKKNLFVKSVRQLLMDDTIFINCPKIKQLDSNHVTLLHQQTILGTEVLSNEYHPSKLFEKII